MQMEQRPKRVSATVREGPIAESRVKQVADVISDTFSCCGSESSCQHRKSLASEHRLNSTSWTRISEIPSDMMQFAMEQAVSGDSQKQDMINRGEDEILDDFQRAVICLKSEHKTFAGANFDRFIKDNGARAMNEVWPLLKQELLKMVKEPENEPDYHFHESAAKKFPFAVVELYHTGNGDGARQLLSVIFEFVPSENPNISRYWGNCLEKLVESCNSSDVQKDIFPVIVERFAGKNSSVNAKIGACQVLRKLATRFNHEVIQKRLFPLFMNNLARDKEPTVRSMAASSLPEMIHRMRSKDQALKLISVLSQDSEPSVRAAITNTIMHSVTLMSARDPKNKTYLESVMQTIKILVKDAYVKGNIDLLVSFSECMGRVCMAFSTADVLKPRDVLWYLDAFLQLSRYDVKDFDSSTDGPEEDTMPTGFANFRANMEFNRRHSIVEALISTKAPGQNEGNKVGQMNTVKAIAALRANTENRRLSIPFGGMPPSGCFRYYGPEFEKAHLCRANAAKEFYDFMLFARPIVDFRHGLHPLVVDLMHDARPEVRAAMAEKILPIMEYLGPEAALLHGEIVYILTDDDLDVIQALVPHIGRILKCLVAVNVLSPDRVTPKLVEIGGAILYCEERLNQTTYYTVHQTMLEQFSTLPFCIPGDYIYSNFVPALFHRLRHMRQIPCRMAAANAIVIFLRHCRRSAQREDIRKRIKEGFAQGRSVHDRMLFLYMAKKIMERFSRMYFRDHFFEDVLVLANDPIINVRRKVMELMPELKGVTEDPALQQKVDAILHKSRRSEVDRDMKGVIEELLSKMNGKKDKDSKRSTKAAAAEPKPKDPDDEKKELEEAFIESLEIDVGKAVSKTTVKEKRKSFFGSTKRKSVTNEDGNGNLPSLPMFQKAAAASNK